MEKYNTGTNEIILKLLILKGKVLECLLPDENYIIMGINIIEKIVKKVNPEEITNENIDLLLETINKEASNNQLRILNHGVYTGMEMGFNTIKKMKNKTHIK